MITLRPIFVEEMPDFSAIKEGDLWISHKYRTVNLRCPCGCGHLTVLSLHPSRWHILFTGKAVSLYGPTGGSIWANSGCGSHYLIRNNVVEWAEEIEPSRHEEYTEKELARMMATSPPPRTLFAKIRDLFKRVL